MIAGIKPNKQWLLPGPKGEKSDRQNKIKKKKKKKKDRPYALLFRDCLKTKYVAQESTWPFTVWSFDYITQPKIKIVSIT